MPRDIPDFSEDWKRPTAGAGHSYDIELITPMFGGGVETRTNDRAFSIRPTAIRGQLQFWWRATVGAKCATKEELRDAQSEIWGSTERASRVQVLLDNVRSGEPEPCATMEWNANARQGQGAWRINWQAPFNAPNSALSYALFPFQGEMPPPRRNATITVPPAACIRQACFRLILRCPNELWPQVEPAVWAWVNFGGLGTRTRRGCGAILCKELAPRDCDHLTVELKRFTCPHSAPREWPTMPTSVLVRRSPTGPIQAWDEAIGRFRHFRQGVGFGRNPGAAPNRPGRSRFSEPETVRAVVGQRAGRHGRLPYIPDDAFPRAEFGLPIVFHFKDDRAGDPPDTVLYPANDADGNRRERMGSPLILKPLGLTNGNALPIILRLNNPHLSSVDLRQGDTSLALPPSTAIRDPRLATYGGSGWTSPLAASSNGSALEAFLGFARSNGFTEVTP
jgi:CRISPR-associated protein Cmr1